MGRRKKEHKEENYCQCCGHDHQVKDNLLVCLHCFRLFERHVRVDLLRRAAAELRVRAKREGLTINDLTSENSFLDPEGQLKPGKKPEMIIPDPKITDL